MKVFTSCEEGDVRASRERQDLGLLMWHVEEWVAAISKAAPGFWCTGPRIM
jgi:hypothetical protein